jgi:LysR family glycine cleavage system transcriptional activator
MSPRRRLPALSSLRAFEAAARHLSFSRAAEELLITQSAVSHHVRKVEEDIGVSLFIRQARAVTLTPAFDLVDKATDEIRRAARRTLRVSLLASFATHWLVPRLPRFTAAYPDIDLVLEPSIRSVNMTVEPIDLAVRYGRGGWHGVQAQRLLTEQISPVCSPALLGPGEPPLQPRDLLRHDLLMSFSKEPFEWQAWSEKAGVDLLQSRSVMLHDYNIVLQAAVDGQGIAMGRRRLIADHLRRGVLVEPFPELAVSEGLGYWTVMPDHPKPQAKVFAQWLASEAAAAMHEQPS